MKRTLLASLLSVVSVTAMAASYQNESSLNFSWGDVVQADLQQWEFSHRYFLTPVQGNVAAPLAESAFLSRNSNVFGDYVRGTQKEDGIKLSSSSWRLGGEYMDSSHDFYVGFEFESINRSSTKSALTQLGYFFDSDWLVTFDIDHTRPDSAGTRTEFGFSTKKLMRLPTGDHLNVEASYRDLRSTSRNAYSFGGDYYFGKELSVGLFYDWTSKNIVSTAQDSFTVRGQWFPMNNLAVRASVSFDSFETGEDLYTVGASYRF
ncbi:MULTISPECIES: putative porin [Alkalimonas]|uniref:Porin n=1 Tax=Alkalimonas mucilaginosa TaxID=3057676 RepID=A0ABU7JJX0_9GAMM|nr:putative porin [Alkalimonas sp. MEB004]MEE2025638.1 putative porin [Alkalimonas sp. MEB004]